MAKRSDYLNYIQTLVNERFNLEMQRIDKFLESDVVTDFGCDSGLYCVSMKNTIYRVTNDKKSLDDACNYFKKILYVFEKQRDANYERTKPIVNRMFGIANLCETYRFFNELGIFTEDEQNRYYDFVVDAASWIVSYPEWGAHNRATIRGRGMIEASKAFPDKPMTNRWRQVGISLLSDSLGKWSIEDAATYQPIWLVDVFDCLDEELVTHFPNADVIVQFYLNYFANMSSPLFIPNEYGDGRLGTQWGHIIDCMERGAKRYHNSKYKYVADRIFNKIKKLDIPFGYKLNQARAISKACENCDDSIPLEPIYDKSLEVLEDVITKKIVFRSGLDEKKDTYLLLNYKDEIRNGVLGRRNLDQTIVAPAEKNHHGHTDENAILFLSYKDSILLHDGGYREAVDMLGAFRADFYHNKLVFRNKVYSNIYKTISNEPYYNKVITEKLYFYVTKDMDVSRTRVYDKKHNVVYDRAIDYLKDDNLFVIVDIVKSEKKQKLFVSNQYFTQNCKVMRDDLFETSFNHIGTDEMNKFIVPNDKKLGIYFANRKENSLYYLDDIRRSYTSEKIISNFLTKTFDKNEIMSFVTILRPYDEGEYVDISRLVRVVEANDGVAVCISINGKKYEICHKYNELLNYEESVRPMYHFESSKVKYDNVTSDAIFSYIRHYEDESHFSFVAGTKVYDGNNIIFETSGYHDFYQVEKEKMYLKIDHGSYNFYEEDYKKVN